MYISRATSRVIAAVIITVFFLSMAFYMNRMPSGRETSAPAASAKNSTPAARPSPVPQPSPLPGQASAVTGAAESDSARFALNEFHRTETRDGHVVWEVHGTHAEYLPASSSVQIKSGVLHFRDKDDKMIVLNAGQAVLEMQGTSLHLAHTSEGVEILYDNKVHIRTDTATYDLEHKQISAPGLVTIKDTLHEISGEELTADLEKKIFELHKNVSTVIQPQKGS